MEIMYNEVFTHSKLC